MNDKYFNNWIMQTATTWDDISDIIECVGINFIDSDHKQLANYLVEINRIIIDLKSNKVDMNLIQQQKDILTKLYDYAGAHFKREEKMISKFKLGGLSVQKEQHTKILIMLESILDSFSKGNTTITEDLKLKILDWLVVHINTYDFNTYNLENWSSQLSEAKTIKDILILIKLSGIVSIDKSNKKLIEHLLKIFNDYSKNSDFIELKKSMLSISDELKKNLENEVEFISKYQLKGDKLQISEHDKLCEFINNEDVEEKDLSKFKVDLLVLILMHISKVDYQLFNVDEHIDNLLLYSSTKAEIDWLIKKTDYPEIDEQHINFVDLLLNFTHELNEANSKEELLEITGKGTSSLIKYARDHFEHEETIMKEKPNLPGINEHKIAHNNILDKLSQIKYFVDNQKVDVFPILRSKILNLWIHHTNSVDQITFKN